MRKEYDFTGAKRAKDVPHLAKLQAEATRGKTRTESAPVTVEALRKVLREELHSR